MDRDGISDGTSVSLGEPIGRDMLRSRDEIPMPNQSCIFLIYLSTKRPESKGKSESVIVKIYRWLPVQLEPSNLPVEGTDCFVAPLLAKTAPTGKK